MLREFPDVRFVAVSGDPISDLAPHSARYPYTLLSDAEGTAIKAWGLHHPGAHPYADAPVARPAVFLVGADGKLLERWIAEDFRVRLRAATMRAALAKHGLGGS